MISTKRAARHYIYIFLALVVTFNVWAATPQAAELEFQGLWQLWHPYMLPYLSLLVVPYALSYGRRTIAGFEGAGAVAKGMQWLLLALLSWAVLGASVYGSYLTCAEWPLWQCSNPVGTVPAPSLADIGSGPLFFTFFALGLSQLSRLVGVDRARVIRTWWLFVVLLVVNLLIATPLGIGRTIPEWQWTPAVAVSMFYVIANVVVSGWTLIIARDTRNAAGGIFFPLIITVLIAAVVSMVNNYLFTGVDSDLASDLSITLFGVMVISLMWSFTIVGGIFERFDMGPSEPTH